MKVLYTPLAVACLSLFVSESSANGLSVIDKTFGGAGKDGLRNVTALRDGGYMLAGWLDQTTKDHFGTGYIVNIGPDGEPRWDKILTTNGRNRVSSVIEQTDGSLLVVVEEFPGAHDPGQSIFMALSSTGDILARHDIGGPGPDVSEQLRPTSDGGYILAGESADSFDGDYQGWIAKLSSTFDVQWEHRVGGQGRDRLTDVIELSGGSFIAVGMQQHQNAAGDWEDKPWLVRVDAQGTLVPSPDPILDRPGAVRGVVQDEDGSLVLAGYVRGAEHNRFAPWIGQATAQGHLTWGRELKFPPGSTLMALEPLPNGNYLATGSARNPDTSFDALLLEFPADGASVTQHSPRKPDTQFGRVAFPVGDNKVALGGFHNQDDGMGDQLWFYEASLSTGKSD